HGVTSGLVRRWAGMARHWKCRAGLHEWQRWSKVKECRRCDRYVRLVPGEPKRGWDGRADALGPLERVVLWAVLLTPDVRQPVREAGKSPAARSPSSWRPWMRSP